MNKGVLLVLPLFSVLLCLLICKLSGVSGVVWIGVGVVGGSVDELCDLSVKLSAVLFTFVSLVWRSEHSKWRRLNSASFAAIWSLNMLESSSLIAILTIIEPIICALFIF